MPETPSKPVPADPPKAVVPMPEPKAGGNYLRDPVTGALSLNPAHEIPQE